MVKVERCYGFIHYYHHYHASSCLLFTLVLPEVLLKTCLVSADKPGHPVYHLNLHLKSDQ